MVNGGHDTIIGIAGQWVDYWLLPFPNDTNFNDNRTLVLLTFDETGIYTVENRILSLLLGGSVPESARGTVDSIYYTDYSLSTVEANGGFGSLGRGDTNKTLSNDYSFVANARGYTNLDVPLADIPLTNITGTIPGPLNAQFYVHLRRTRPPSVGGGPVFVTSGLDTSFTAASAPSHGNLTAQGKTVPWLGRRVFVQLAQWQRQRRGGRQGGHHRRHGTRHASCGPFGISFGLRSGLQIPHERCCPQSYRTDEICSNAIEMLRIVATTESCQCPALQSNIHASS
ncbi:hypothetical protein BJY52DRAFT_1421507 [Lactarius psammicola]|nr:hypothetical protein BJY52DRAFT_1421507 [Lactarius psammicola]